MHNLSFNDIILIKTALRSEIERQKNLAAICPASAELFRKDANACERIIQILGQVQDKILENRSFCARLYCQL